MRKTSAAFLITLTATLFAAPVAAQQNDETFVFSGTSKEGTLFGSPDTNASDYRGYVWTGTNSTTMAGGTNIDSSFTCMMMDQPPSDSIYGSHMLCNVEDASGTYSAAVGCVGKVLNANEGIACMGGMTGISGQYQGRKGLISFRTSNDRSFGTGQWFR